ncbi:poly [ADP-ribose] polymerase 9 isoform X3 [Alligator sinensis]|uniref:Poly [ADP-ribose] polymerase 9 isoform X1 n=1 Tax=Alligator sinensis TaxID=38654 RepID=A0A3Q0FYZ9_ALLSI|nr:poly [ADP-ribose] polymerase 9 isoform X1 [Alligator sinensis]XP_025052771.1 poly [ADP-ribose] polymerase 9 isoform X2 [Alligator sinensis]XP_025052772.1 poly [ADP-ribose] polymerase 9 isoform X1 [Alligator sinensis]XP_025052773.1 poly [ADP-ribose] polymerase 9 isoform X1 [Alligator sinensis]XP_025052774.1 poly [ADP-ribose] polymerase 9 isoform X1 [Alligator sinensis]XP_025052775.1 poly [ADP-ribose] polymerase 9 isoform X1 [Alligator sinensis]XP_025052776.1 poly [ADP-ribose] polymerase 9 i
MAMEEENVTIVINRDVYEILKKREGCLRDLLWKKFGCTPVFKGRPCPVEVYRKSPKRGIELSVWMDDITTHNADALVNAANEFLNHGAGLALALAEAGGPAIKEQSRLHIERYGTLKAGDIAVTGGGKLPCKAVIHAVGPRWLACYKDECCHKLEVAITNILTYVNKPESYIGSVAIPAVSSGIFGFPLDMCASVIVHTIKTFVDLAPVFPHLKEIRLVNIDEPTVAAIKQACEACLGSSDTSALQGTAPASSSSSPDSITINGLPLHIKRGLIENQRTDIIVNSVGMHSDLKVGEVSKAILGKGGPSLEKEFQNNLKKHLPFSEEQLVWTKGHNLASKTVLHVVWPYSIGDKYKVLKTAMAKCLLEFPSASVSFPALGIEKLHLAKDEVAGIMIDEVLKFAKEQPSKKIEVFFVLHPNDNDVYKAFKMKLDSAKRQLGERMVSNKHQSLGSDRQAEAKIKKDAPVIVLSGNRCETLEAAQMWIKSITEVQKSHLFRIENHHIFNFGKKEFVELSRQQSLGVSISEEVKGGKTRLEIQGSPDAVIEAVFAIENMLYYVQEKNIVKQEEMLLSEGQQGTDPISGRHQHQTRPSTIQYQTMLVEPKCQEFGDRKRYFEKNGLRILKIEKIHNPVLSTVFQQLQRNAELKNKGKQVCQRLYQRVPAQFCRLVCRAGFQRLYSPPPEKAYGSGIYFKKNPRNLIEDNEQCDKDHLICVFEAEVITGSYARGGPSCIVPPAFEVDGKSTYKFDSVVDDVHDPTTFVIFNSKQALPKYLLTCHQIQTDGPGSSWICSKMAGWSLPGLWGSKESPNHEHRGSPKTKY